MSDQPADRPVRQFRFRPPPGACDLLLVRHGESQAAVPGQPFPTVAGQGDPPLAEEGLAEAKAVAERLQHEEIAAIYTTPLTRTKQTAAPLAERLGLVPQEETDLREVFLGEWDGTEYRVRARQGDPLVDRVVEAQDWGVIPGAESRAEFCDRVAAGINRIATAHPDQRVVAFVHAGVIGAALHLATNADPFAFIASANGSLNHLVISAERWIVRRFNDTGHLDTDLDKPVRELL